MEDNGREIGRETTILKNKDKNMQNTILIILLIIVLISIWFFYIDRKINIIVCMIKGNNRYCDA